MPSKPKYTREEMLEAALGIVRTEGEEALTARHLGEVMGTSSRPVFTLFDSMEDLICALREPALAVFGEACSGFGDFKPAFKKLGQNLVAFATDEPHLFRFLFIDAHGESKSLEEWCGGELGDAAVVSIMQEYDLDEDTARLLFRETWVHVFAICVLKVTGAVSLTEREVSDSMSRAFTGLLGLAKSGHLGDAGITRNVLPQMPNRRVGFACSGVRAPSTAMKDRRENGSVHEDGVGCVCAFCGNSDAGRCDSLRVRHLGFACVW